MLALLAGTAVGGFAAAQPAAAGHNAGSATWISQRYTDSLDVHSSLAPDTEIPLGAWLDADGKRHMSRVYATYDLSDFAGKKVFTAQLYANEEEATNCADREVEVWVTPPATDPTWADPPAEQNLVGTIGGSSQICPGSLSMNMTSAVQQALSAGQTRLGVELRVPADDEGDTKLGRWLNAQYGVQLRVDYNTLPEVPTRLYANGMPCATQAPYPYLPNLQPSLGAVFEDKDPNDTLTGAFAIWPVGTPDKRTTFNTTGYTGSGWVSWAKVPAGVVVDGGTYGWQARLDDGTDTSDWSQTCYFSTDATRPANAPQVTSSNYPQGSFVDGGTPAHFTFAPNGADDIIGYQYSWNNYPGVICTISYGDYGVPTASEPLKEPGVVPADGLGGSASVDLSPPWSGPNRLYVESIDRACNESPVAEYDVLVRDTSPTIVTSGEPMVGKPFTLTVKPNPAVIPVLSYRYQISFGDTQTVAASADGSASITFTPQCFCSVDVEVSSVSANGWVSPAASYRTYISSAPVISSDIYPDYLSTGQSGGGVGVTGHFTFASPLDGTVAYQYWIDWAETATVTAGADGTATIAWTPDTSGYHEIEVYALDANGSAISDLGTYDLYVTDPTS